MSASPERSTGRVASILILAAATLACLLPFVGKAFHMDDPFFVWAARQIHSRPLDFYGFTVNWDGFVRPATEAMKNPPLASYYAALAAYAFGWGETALHLAFLLPAVAAVAGTYLLAREFCARPLAAALITLAAPVFLVSATSVMCDVMMVSFYVWSVFLWVRGMKSDGIALLACASVLVALCGLTKYFGISLIPLLAAHTLAASPGKRHRALLLLVPVAILALYQWATHAAYGRGLLMDAAAYATESRQPAGLVSTTVIGLSFTGGCLASTVFFAPLLWRRRALAVGAILVAAGAIVLRFVRTSPDPDELGWLFGAQYALFVAAGAHVLLLAGLDLLKRRDAASLLLILWIGGTFVFAAFVNWTASGRAVLPMAPAAGILVVRRLEDVGGPEFPATAARAMLPLVPALALSMSVAWADWALAESARTAAAELSREYGGPSARLSFQGHWGFQYYMEQAGAVAFDAGRPWLSSGRIMVVPENNSNLFPKAFDAATPVAVRRFGAAPLISTINRHAGAGFYCADWGPLPFAVGRVPDETYHVLRFVWRP